MVQNGLSTASCFWTEATVLLPDSTKPFRHSVQTQGSVERLHFCSIDLSHTFLPLSVTGHTRLQLFQLFSHANLTLLLCGLFLWWQPASCAPAGLPVSGPPDCPCARNLPVTHPQQLFNGGLCEGGHAQVPKHSHTFEP